MLKMSLWMLILAKPPDHYSGEVLEQRPEMRKISFQMPNLDRFWARGQKCVK